MSEHVGWMYKYPDGEVAANIEAGDRVIKNAADKKLIFDPQRLYTEEQMREVVESLSGIAHRYMDFDFDDIIEKYREVLK
jgi:hypothetical protein